MANTRLNRLAPVQLQVIDLRQHPRLPIDQRRRVCELEPDDRHVGPIDQHNGATRSVDEWRVGRTRTDRAAGGMIIIIAVVVSAQQGVTLV